MSKMSDMLNGKSKVITTKTVINNERDLNDALEKLRGLIKSGITDLARGFADELEKSKNDDEYCNDDVAKNHGWEDKASADDSAWTTKPKEMVNHPSHYQGKRFEVIDIIEDYDLGFNLGNAVKYILRAGHKDLYEQDLKKAIWYLEREISSDKNISKGL